MHVCVSPDHILDHCFEFPLCTHYYRLPVCVGIVFVVMSDMLDVAIKGCHILTYKTLGR